MEMREFTENDWLGLSGATRWENSEPLLAEGAFEDGMGWLLVLDRQGGCLIADDAQAQFGGYLLRREFPDAEAARLFAAFLGEPRTRYEFFVAGFRAG